MNEAWLITHDNYIDRRIFFFADVLQSKGYKVKLFPSYFFDLLSDADPDYVERPNDVQTIKKYRASLDEIFPEGKELIANIKKAQEAYKSTNGTYAKGFRDLKLNVSNYRKNRPMLKAFDDFYVVITHNTPEAVIYNSLTDEYTICYDSKKISKSSEHESAIIKYMTHYHDYEGVACSFGNINIKSEINDYGENLLYAHNISMNNMYCYNSAERILTEIKPIPFGNYNQDELGDEIFDYIEYKKIVYDYSPILENVKRMLRHNTPDLVYIADLPTLPIGIMLKEVTGCKLIIDCHEWWFKQARLWESTFAKKIELSEEYEAKLYPKCDLCITVGEYLAADMSKCYQKPFEVVYSCMNEELSVKASDYSCKIWNELFGIPLGGKIAVFQGSMTTLRNLDNLARATKYMDEDQYLIVVGGGPYEPEFKRILQSEGNPERVFFTGWVNQKDLMKYTVNADLGVLPYSAMDEYFSYSVPNKLMEYFEAMVPMLFDVSMREISMVAGNNNVGVGADLSNAEVFGNKIKELLNSPEMLMELRNNYKLCKDKFRFENQKQHFAKLIDQYIGD